MWQLLWAIAPDVIAVIVLIIKITRIWGSTSANFAEWIVDQVTGEFKIGNINVDTRVGAIELISSLMDLEQLRDAIRMASLMSLAGTLVLISNPSFKTQGELLCISWFVLFALTLGKDSTHTQDKRAHRKKKIWWYIVFSLYMFFSILGKTVAFGSF